MKFSLNSILLFFTSILLFFMILIFNNGCATKTEIITKYRYIKPTLPKLQTYDVSESLEYTFYNKGNKVCVVQWKTCIPKDQMIKLIKYIEKLKLQLKKCNNQAIQYNKMLKKMDLTK